MTRLVAAALLLLISVACALAEVTAFQVLPSLTDPAIRNFDFPHYIYVDRDIVVSQKPDLPQDRGQLLVFLPGTGGKAAGAQAFLNLAASLGYHVVSLMYPDEIPATACDGDPNPNAFERFRLAIIQGGDATIKSGREGFAVSQTDSIENRLSKLLLLLSQKRPREHWDQFVSSDGSLRWQSIAVAGQSQGGGHAALIGIKHEVARVLCFGAPKDFSTRLNAPAAWYSDPSATPKSRFFAFNHVQDPKGCTPEQLLMNLKTLRLDSIGGIAQVDQDAFPYKHARILYTAFPQVVVQGENSEGAAMAHGSAINTRNADRWKQVWTYLLTEG